MKVVCENISKVYRLFRSKTDRIKEFVHPLRTKFHTDFFALRDINLSLEPGKTLGIIGRNGSGKSTLLKILSGVTVPTAGRVSVPEKIGSLLELGAGFHPEMTGIENIYLHGLLRGIPREVTRTRLDSVLDFSGIGEYAHQPVKSYSSGMFVRLAFAAEVQTKPDVLIIDEALSVGDASFQVKCVKKIQSLTEQGTSLIFVSHDMSIVRTLCEHAILLDAGRIAAEGSPARVLDVYNGMIGFPDERAPLDSYAKRSGTGELKYSSIWISDSQGRKRDRFTSGERIQIHMEIDVSSTVENPTIGFAFRDRSGGDVFGINSALLGLETGSFITGSKRKVFYEMDLNLGHGVYTLSASIHQFEVHTGSAYDWINDALAIHVDPDPAMRFSGVARIVPKLQL